MPELLLELFSEEIPARMQARGAERLVDLFLKQLSAWALSPVKELRVFHGPRRIGFSCVVPARSTPKQFKPERGPPSDASERAKMGFVRKHVPVGTEQEVLARLANEVSVTVPGAVPVTISKADGRLWATFDPRIESAETVIERAFSSALTNMSWPKVMRWTAAPSVPWIRPLRRILCTLDGRVLNLRPPWAGANDVAGLVASNLTEGHRFLAPGPIAVQDYADYQEKLRAHHVIVDATERRAVIEAGAARLAASVGCRLVPDPALLDEVAGLVEWPVPLLGRIDTAFMDLPARVRQVTMRANQKYFSLETNSGAPAPFFVLVANIEAKDGGAAIIAGNERVLRARLADARFFWDQDRKQRLDARLPRLETVTFHARLGTQGARALRLVRLAGMIARRIGADVAKAERAALLAKADLVTLMVGEFPELQGYMGARYAAHDGEDVAVARAIEEHYAPQGQGDAVPDAPVSVTVALADRLDTLAGFFAIDERPTGSGDPFALRRAALGVIRLVRENGLRLDLADLIAEAFLGYPDALAATAAPEFGMAVAQEAMAGGFRPAPGSPHPPLVQAFARGVFAFLVERLRVQLRAEGRRHDVIAATLAHAADGDLVRLLARADALAALLGTEDGANLLTAHRRATNILRIEERKDGRSHDEPPDPALLRAPAEAALAAALEAAEPVIAARLAEEDFAGAMAAIAGLRAPLDAFFDAVTVNATETMLRANRLRLLARIRAVTARVADFSLLEG